MDDYIIKNSLLEKKDDKEKRDSNRFKFQLGI